MWGILIVTAINCILLYNIIHRYELIVFIIKPIDMSDGSTIGLEFEFLTLKMNKLLFRMQNSRIDFHSLCFLLLFSPWLYERCIWCVGVKKIRWIVIALVPIWDFHFNSEQCLIAFSLPNLIGWHQEFVEYFVSRCTFGITLQCSAAIFIQWTGAHFVYQSEIVGWSMIICFNILNKLWSCVRECVCIIVSKLSWRFTIKRTVGYPKPIPSIQR